MSDIEHVHRLIFQGRVEELSELLRQNPELASARNTDGDQPIHSACWAKQVHILGVLFAHSIDVNARGCYGRTALHYAVHEGDTISVGLVLSLLMNGADPTIRDDNHFTPADWAKVEMDRGLPEVLALLRDPYAMLGKGQR